MKIKKQKVIKIKFDFLTANVYIITRKKDLKIMKNKFKDSYISFKHDKNFVGISSGDGYKNYIYIKDASVATLAHEALHIIQRICDRTGMVDEEVKCYMLHYIIEQVIGE